MTLFSQGHFANVVRRTAARIGADLIVSYDEVDVAQAEARLIARPRRSDATSAPTELGLRKILVAVDHTDASFRAVAHISEFVDAGESEINVLFAPEHADNTASGFGRIDTALARQGLMARQHLTVEADPAQDILRRAEQTGTDLIVLQSGMRKGRILRKIANHAGCSVLAI
jgi:nucleotide-binding universal stress UspA family protein